MKIEFEISEQELNIIQDILGQFTNFEKQFSKEQLENFVKNLPEDILLEGLKWGFSDTEVREKIYSYIEQNKSLTEIFELLQNV